MKSASHPSTSENKTGQAPTGSGPANSTLPSVTMVFPCLNESATLAGCIEQARQSFEKAGVTYEILVADNGSTDDSRSIAETHGATVVPVSERGYGAALRGGIAAARTEYVIFADADGTYPVEDAAKLFLKAKEEDADLVVASRLKGVVEPGAMPPLHRYLGTPVLTGLINFFFRGRLSDCNSGFRCIRKSAYESWGIRSNGMEFASELLIKALKPGAKVVEVASGLRPSPADRQVHLKTWQDGMRHLLFIFSERPQFFEYLGAALIAVSTLLQFLAWAVGPTKFLAFNIFDHHSQALLLLGGAAGAQLYLFSCYLYLSGGERSTGLTRRLLYLNEGTLFFLLLGLFFIQFLVAAFVLLKWAAASFGGIDLVSFLFLVLHGLIVAGSLTVGLLGIHVFKKSSGLATAAPPVSPSKKV